jgi:hypothetical protein
MSGIVSPTYAPVKCKLQPDFGGIVSVEFTLGDPLNPQAQMTNCSNQPLPARQRRRLQFTFRTLLLSVAIAAFVIYIASRWWPLVRAQHAIQAAASDYYWDFFLKPDGIASFAGTNLDDDGLQQLAVHFKNHPNLTLLILNGTKVSDDGLEYLSGLTMLRRLELIDTCVTDNGVAKLQQTLPQLEIIR